MMITDNGKNIYLSKNKEAAEPQTGGIAPDNVLLPFVKPHLSADVSISIMKAAAVAEAWAK